MKSVYVETYGCSANQARSETMEGSLAANGMKITKNMARADVILLNTCIVKTPTENRIRDRIKSVVRKYPRKTLIIAGCAADVALFRDIAPGALFLSSHNPKDVAKLLLKKAGEITDKKRKNPLVGITEISSGCLGSCAYCMVKLARGRLKSRSVEEITAEIRNSLENGCIEIWLTSQDNSCYGLDIGSDLAKLVKKVSEIDGEFRVRIGMMNPSHLASLMKQLIEAYKNNKVYRFIHIPVQSGSDRILKLMGRRYSVKAFERIAGEFRNSLPGITLSTDVIVGFPGESESDFDGTLALIERIRPDIVNVSKFGARPGTDAARMRQLDNKIIKERSKKIAALVRKIGMEINAEFAGRKYTIIVTERGKHRNQYMGRNEFYKPVIIESTKNVLGKFLKVKITKCGQTFLAAKIIRS